MNIEPLFQKISFVSRYKHLCVVYHDFENRMNKRNKKLYDSFFSTHNYQFKYVSPDRTFYLEDQVNGFLILLSFTVHDGIIEPRVAVKLKNEFCLPGGRFDFLAEKIDPNYDRSTYALTKYRNENEFEEILRELFSIYEDLKEELKKEICGGK